MRTIALRFADNFAPSDGTINQHMIIIQRLGYVWYGKLGSPISKAVEDNILNNDTPRILLIHSGSSDRYWAYVKMISREQPEGMEYPGYYGEKAEKMSTWFCLTHIEKAPKDILGQCRVASSGATLTEASRSSMSPYFIIDAPDEIEGW